MKRSPFAAGLALALSAGAALAQTDLLPDIIIDKNYLYDNYIETVSGRTYVRLSNGTANIGAGKLYLRGGNVIGGNQQEVIQRIYRDDGTYWERTAGTFIYHPGHGHIHYNEWCEYRVREVLANDGVGDILAVGNKTSFCILDLRVYDNSLPGFPPGGEFNSCGTAIQGLSVGWEDIYSNSLSGQAIDITGIPDGEYWLESEVDPNNNSLESNEGNNVERIKLFLGSGGTLEPDAYEENDSRTDVNARQEGGPFSPNLGPTGPETVITDLTIDGPGDDDYFKFYMPATGTGSDLIRIEFVHAIGDLDMELQNSSGGTLARSDGVSNFEQITLSGRPAGWYFIRVYGYAGAISPLYTLTVNPSSNQTPQIDVLTPPAGDTVLQRGADGYLVEWDVNDPESNQTWVSIYLNDQPVLDGTEFLLDSSLNSPGAGGGYLINSAEFAEGTYWVYASVTDGGSIGGSWSDGTVTWVDLECQADLTGSSDPNDPGYGIPDGVVDANDFFFYLDLFAAGDLRADYTTSSDPNNPFYGVPDGVVDSNDFFYFLDRFVEGCP
ncbi:MAG: hypothetical protein H6811_03780 [Phycisphaeraceae bacterium]|nr:hypothetical protein [Phycisphaeraceae bacterium]